MIQIIYCKFDSNVFKNCIFLLMDLVFSGIVSLLKITKNTLITGKIILDLSFHHEF